MTRTDLLLAQVAEEAVEIAQRATKALRFGLEEVQPGQELNNADRILREYLDLLTVLELLAAESPVFRQANRDVLPLKPELCEAKRKKLEEFMSLSEECGRLEQVSSEEQP